MIPICLILFILFIAVITFAIKRADSAQAKVTEDFWEKERKANSTLRGDTTDLCYITIPEKFFPLNNDKINDLRDKTLVNLTGMTNTDLKLKYGILNFKKLSEYDDNFTKFVSMLPDYYNRLKEAGYESLGNELLDFIGDDIILGQNVTFDYSFLKQWAVNHKRTLSLNAYDTLKIARKCLPAEQSKKLEDLCEYFDVSRENAHRALDDAIETKQIFEKLLALMDEKGEPVEPKPLVYKAKKQTPATAHQVRQLKELMTEYGIADVISWDNLTRSQASRLYDEYRSKYINRCV